MSLDPISLKLLGQLRRDSRTKYTDLGAAIHLSAPAVFDRVKKLESKGVIRKYTIEVEPAALDLETCAFVQIRSVDPETHFLPKNLETFSEIEECHSIAGEDCILAKVRTANAAALYELLKQIKSLPGVERTLTTIVLSTYFERGIQPDATNRD